jgi:hypothetical protein
MDFDYNIIHDWPSLPQPLIDAINSGKLAIFIGAGVSRIIGCQGWGDLASDLLKECYQSKTKRCINFKEHETLKHEKDNKKLITLCHYILRENGLEKTFWRKFDKSLEAKKDLEIKYNIYEEIFGLGGLFITTNADKHFDHKFSPENIVFTEDGFNPETIGRHKLYHIHGIQGKKDSLIFTVDKYIKRYNNENIKLFLEQVFEKYTVLFLGYGMSEFEVLDFLISKYDKNAFSGGHKEVKHFTLLPFFKGEQNILRFNQDYYNRMGVRVIAYEADQDGYNKLYEIIKRWRSEILQSTTLLNDTFREIEDLVASL